MAGQIPDTPEFRAFVTAVNDAYKASDGRFSSLERALEISSDEANNELQNFRTAIDEATMVVHFDREGVITFANQGFSKLTGYENHDICGKKVASLLGNQQLYLIDQAVVQLTLRQTWKNEVYFHGKNGKKIWIHCTMVPLMDPQGKITRYLALMIDITSRKVFEEEIIHSENKYKRVINSIKEVIFQTDLKGEWTFLNQAWSDITGFNIYDTLGHNLSNYIHPEDADRVWSQFERLSNGQREYSSCAIRFKTTLDQYRWCDVFARVIRDDKNNICGISGTLNDVTEKRRNEELLINSYSFQRAILDSARQAIISTDQHGIIRSFNTGAEHLLGYAAEEVVGQTDPSIFFLPEEFGTDAQQKNDEQWSSACLNTLFNFCEAGQGTDAEYSFIDKSGVRKPVVLSMNAIRDHQLTITGYLFIATDNTLRKQTEAENIKLNLVLEESPDYVVYYDLNRQPQYANKAYKSIRYFGTEETNVPLYPPWVEVIINKKAIPNALSNGSWKGETAILDYNGNEIPVLQLIIVHKDDKGNPMFMSSVMRDITQRKQYEQRLLQSEKRNRDIINYSQGVICSHELDGTIISINPAGCVTTGYSLEELIGKSIVDFIPDQHKEAFVAQYLSSFTSGRTAEGILSLRHKQGHLIHLLYQNYKVEEVNGSKYIIGFAQDVTERLQAENELKDAKQTAEESMKAKELFLANMSHEIRTPMNGIVGLTNLLLHTPLNEKQQQYATSVKHSAENLLVIINDILDFSKIEAGKLEITKAPFDLTNLIYNVRSSFQYEAQSKGIQFITNLEDNTPSLLIGDQVRINQILVNLISNAIKFTEHGSVTLNIGAIKDSDHAVRLRFTVIDTGIGIAKEKVEKIFQSFTQANADTSRKYGGTGLGLSIVKSLLELMGSQIKIKSRQGHGSTFYFDVTFGKSGKLDSNPTSDTEFNFTDKLKGIRILLAEDNKVNQLFVSELMNDWGAELDVANDGKEAIDLYRKNHYDIVLMDIQMPIMSGLDATLIIRTEMPESKRQVPIIAMTANAMKGDDDKFLKAGMNAVVFKPFESLELFSKIGTYLRDYRPVESNTVAEQVIAPAAQTIAADEPILKYADLKVLKAYSRGKNSFVMKMLGVITETVPVTLQELETAIETENWQQVNKSAHKLIPNMNMTGNKELETTMKWIEDLALNPEIQPFIKARWERTKPLMTNVLAELHEAMEYFQKIIVTTQ